MGPYLAMPAEMTDGYAERTRLMTWRVAVLALAILLSGTVSPIVVKAAGAGPSLPLAELAAALGFSLEPDSPMAPVNTLLDAVPPEVREQPLTAFLSYLQRPAW